MRELVQVHPYEDDEVHMRSAGVDFHVNTEADVADAWDWTVLITLLCLLGAMQLICGMRNAWVWLCPKLKHQRTVSTQSQATYTSVRHAEVPRFLPLPEHAHCAWVEG